MHGGLVEEFLLENEKNFNFYFLSRYIRNRIIDFADLQFSDKIICVSHKMIRYLQKKGILYEKMEYITNGVDIEFFKSVKNEDIKSFKKRLGVENKFVFGYLGNFHKWQGLENFIEAAKKIDDKNFAFLIAGGKKTLKNKNITFIRRLSRNQIPYYYSMCDVLVLPRPSHPATEIAAPTKFAEYVAMGKPILTTNVGDAAEFVMKYNCGIVVKNNSVMNLIDGINKFKDKSEKELKDMGKNSRKLAKDEFDEQKICNNLIKALSNV
jgi:glycosyltransferase involved in cell wall biosynthesis